MLSFTIVIGIIAAIAITMLLVEKSSNPNNTCDVKVECDSVTYGDYLLNFTRIDGDLFYENFTHVCYFKNTTYSNRGVYVPYYAPNGKPFKYDKDKKTVVEIGE